VLPRENGTLICISRQPLSLLAPFFCNDFYLIKGFQNTKITGFGALAGQMQHMAAQKVRTIP
jgi:hypothetical protein